MRIQIIAVGKCRTSAIQELCSEYAKRLSWKMTITEIDSKKNMSAAQECEALLNECPKDGIVVALDERGKTLSSDDFSDTIKNWQNTGHSSLTFIIGGADGLNDALRQRANLLLSFGKQTWPHMLVRVMLIEQIYRAQQILAGHPYHRR